MTTSATSCTRQKLQPSGHIIIILFPHLYLTLCTIRTFFIVLITQSLEFNFSPPGDCAGIGFLLVSLQFLPESRQFERRGEGEVDLEVAAFSKGDAQAKPQSRLRECAYYKPECGPTFDST